MVLRVTGADIARAVQGDCNECALAVAAKRILGLEGVSFGALIVLLEYPDKVVRYQATPRTQLMVKAFDVTSQERNGPCFVPGIYDFIVPKQKFGSRAGKGGGKSTGTKFL